MEVEGGLLNTEWEMREYVGVHVRDMLVHTLGLGQMQ
jgi:hypothetical protein